MTDKEKADKYLEKMETITYDLAGNALDISCELGNAYIDGLKEGRKDIAQLEEQIEMMKCCENCKNVVWHYIINDSCPCDDCNDNNSKWELKDDEE